MESEMREIKFRAWDKEDKIIHDGAEIGSINGLKFYELIESKRYKLMQYTGLKDKNGKDIYEGDILKDDDGDLDEVSWNELYACWSIDVGGNGDKPLEDFEVVGNKYQNPKLLKEVRDNGI